MADELPTQLNIADWFLDAGCVKGGDGNRINDARRFNGEVQALANRYISINTAQFGDFNDLRPFEGQSISNGLLSASGTILRLCRGRGCDRIGF